MDTILLDGGMGQELVARAGRATSLWAVQALLDDPGLVRAVHDDFFAAGADVATTNTYSILPDRLEAHGMEDQLGTLTASALSIAANARDAWGSGLVAGALGPIGFSYQPRNAPPSDVAAEIYAPIVRQHAEIVDLHLLETMSSVDQARGAVMAAELTGKPIWLALSVDDDDGTMLRSGEPLADIRTLLGAHRIDRLVLNCSVPEAIEQGLAVLREMGLPFGAYANGFTEISQDFNKIGATTDLLKARQDLGPEAYADHTDRWREMGATLIGGCCEISPAHIAEIARRWGRRL